MWRTTPNENLPAPSERLFNRKLRTPITITKTTTDISQEKITRQILNLNLGDKVLMKKGQRKWFSGY
jgi:hypothetical protein